MPARKKKAEAAAKSWEKRKTKSSPINRPKKLKGWSDESMIQAMQAVKDGTMSANMAARTYSVPPSTLKDRVYLAESSMAPSQALFATLLMLKRKSWLIF